MEGWREKALKMKGLKGIKCQYGLNQRGMFSVYFVSECFWDFRFWENGVCYGDFSKSDIAILGISCYMSEYL